MSLPLPNLSPAGKQRLDEFLIETVNGREVPALFFGATNATEIIYFNQAGERVFGEPEKGAVDENTTLQLFSMTKFVTAIGCMRAVDAGLLDLESEELIATHLPELQTLQILEGYTDEGKEIYKPASQKITLKMLLSHNAGLAYDFNSPLMLRWKTEHHTPTQFSADTTIESIIHPLLYEPGTKWHYSDSIDWAGALLSRVTGKSLEEYFKSEIFSRCGMTSTSFFPTEELKSRMMEVCGRDADGKTFALIPPAMGREMDPTKVGPFLAGGAGLFGTARDYLSLLREVLASSPNNPSPPTFPLISTSSFEALFTHACPSETPLGPTTVKADLAKMAKEQNYHDPALLTNGTGEFIGHGLALFLNLKDSKYGRKAGSGCWDGAAKTQFWIDPASGLAGVCCTNLLAHNPDPFNGVYTSYERLLYDFIEESKYL
ncbi:hypothetical protein P7C70_g2387, partial [Phenoliferia sp. Uapishka_3]